MFEALSEADELTECENVLCIALLWKTCAEIWNSPLQNGQQFVHIWKEHHAQHHMSAHGSRCSNVLQLVVLWYE